MRFRVLCPLFLSLIAACSFAQNSSSTSSAPEAPKEVPSFDLTAIDKTVDPCVDFYQYAGGTWMKNNPHPGGQVPLGPLQSAGGIQPVRPARHSGPDADARTAHRHPDEGGEITTPPVWTRRRFEKKKETTPLDPTMEAIAAIKTKQGLIEEVGVLHRNGVTSTVPASGRCRTCARLPPDHRER